MLEAGAKCRADMQETAFRLEREARAEEEPRGQTPPPVLCPVNRCEDPNR